MKTAVAIRHVAFEDLGSLAKILKQQDYAMTYVEAGLDSIAEINPLSPNLLVILGGPIGAYEEQDYPFLLDELRLLERRLTPQNGKINDKILQNIFPIKLLWILENLFILIGSVNLNLPFLRIN